MLITSHSQGFQILQDVKTKDSLHDKGVTFDFKKPAKVTEIIRRDRKGLIY